MTGMQGRVLLYRRNEKAGQGRTHGDQRTWWRGLRIGDRRKTSTLRLLDQVTGFPCRLRRLPSPCDTSPKRSTAVAEKSPAKRASSGLPQRRTRLSQAPSPKRFAIQLQSHYASASKPMQLALPTVLCTPPSAVNSP